MRWSFQKRATNTWAQRRKVAPAGPRMRHTYSLIAIFAKLGLMGFERKGFFFFFLVEKKMRNGLREFSEANL
jgi:hypothetical protein